jgi:cytochrome bd-type quinol oxidase subunit 1
MPCRKRDSNHSKRCAGVAAEAAQERTAPVDQRPITVLGSIWLTHSLDGRVEGLKNTPVDRQPQMGWVFYGFRVMYGIAIIMFGVAVASLWLALAETSLHHALVPARPRGDDAIRAFFDRLGHSIGARGCHRPRQRSG